MKFAALALCVFLPAAWSQIFTFSRDQMIKYTEKNPYDRFPDGRPKVPDDLLERFKELTSEEVWAALPKPDYANQFEDGWQILHPGKKLVGRAVTAQFMPYRADVAQVAEAEGKARFGGRSPNQRVIDQLQAGDVIVVDLFGKIEDGTFVGDNLATYIQTVTGTGIVVDGGIRDLEGIFPLGMPVYYRGAHPTAIRNVMLTGYNIPIRIGKATVMPGDVVFADREGVWFIPPHLVEKVLEYAERTRIHDEWTQQKLRTGKYKSSEIYSTPTDPELKKEYEEYLKKRLEERRRRRP
jgi:4-hydroxy-4-methyl-2-oxoglutarate aldolase